MRIHLRHIALPVSKAPTRGDDGVGFKSWLLRWSEYNEVWHGVAVKILGQQPASTRFNDITHTIGRAMRLLDIDRMGLSLAPAKALPHNDEPPSGCEISDQ